MTVHFICRGNTFRSVLAEAYLRSLGLPNVQVTSSGTRGEQDKAPNAPKFQLTLQQLEKHGIKQFAKAAHGEQVRTGNRLQSDVVVCISEIAKGELAQLVTSLDNVRVWDIPDIGEPGRVPKDADHEQTLREDVFQEIVQHVDMLVDELNLAPTRN